MARADKPLLHTLETRGLLHTPCCALSRGYKRLSIGGLVEPGAHLLHTPCNGVCRVCGPRPCYKPLALTRSHMKPYATPIMRSEPSSLSWPSSPATTSVGTAISCQHCKSTKGNRPLMQKKRHRPRTNILIAVNHNAKIIGRRGFKTCKLSCGGRLNRT